LWDLDATSNYKLTKFKIIHNRKYIKSHLLGSHLTYLNYMGFWIIQYWSNGVLL